MNWNVIEGRWGQMKGELRNHWAKLTDDDLEHVAAKKDKLVGKLQERYGMLKEEAERQIDAWISRLDPPR
jgi:uncharacterized protein YjbJ (UPF0337 family)